MLDHGASYDDVPSCTGCRRLRCGGIGQRGIAGFCVFFEAKADSSTPTHKSPSPVAALTMVGLALLAAARRVR